MLGVTSLTGGARVEEKPETNYAHIGCPLLGAVSLLVVGEAVRIATPEPQFDLSFDFSFVFVAVARFVALRTPVPEKGVVLILVHAFESRI